MANAPRFRNLRIGLVLAVCYVMGMIAAFYATETVRRLRSGGSPPAAEGTMAQLDPAAKPLALCDNFDLALAVAEAVKAFVNCVR